MTRLSNRQYPMLQTFMEHATGGEFYMSIEAAQAFDQRPFRSMLIQRWIVFVPGRGFRITKEGRAAWREFHETSIMRLHPEMPLTAYFDADAYGLTKPKAARVHVLPARHSAA
jgi:hypothetical protein